MNTNMSSIRSILIRTSMTNIQKEISQLEHWLNNLSDNNLSDNNTSPIPSQPKQFEEFNEISNLNRVIERLVDEVSNQRHTLTNILERIDNLEGFSRNEREIFINENIEQTSNQWLDLHQNCQEETHSKESFSFTKSLTSKSSVATPSIIPDIPEDKSIIPDIDSINDFELDTKMENNHHFEKVEEEQHEQEEEEEEQEEEQVEEQQVEEQQVEKQEEEQQEENEQEEEEEEEEQVEEEQVEEEQVEEEHEQVEHEQVEEEQQLEEKEEEQEEEEQEEEQQVEEQVEEEEEEEQEEDGKEFEEIEYKGVKYYRDEENFIYSIDEEEQPSENPIGYWKEKAQTIAFYKTK
jgi:hypothetical protein